MANKRIFISSGQLAEEEKKFRQEIRSLVDACNMIGFFAEEAHDAADLNTSLFQQLRDCDGFIGVMHKRGEVNYSGFESSNRASVWIHQEIAILFYRSFLLQRPTPIPMRLYVEKGIRHEGLTQFSMVNPIPFEVKETVLKDLGGWLGGPSFEEQPALARREDLFRRRALTFGDDEWLLLEVIAAHSRSISDQPIPKAK